MVHRAFAVFFSIFLLFFGIDTVAQSSDPDSEQPTLKRIVIVTPPGTPDARIAKWLGEDARSGKRKAARSRFSDILQEKPKPEPLPTGTQLQTYAGLVFAKALEQKLQRRARSLIVPQPKARQAAAFLLDKEQARQLCQEMQADALMQIATPHIEIREGIVRDVIVRTTVHLPYARPVQPKADVDPMFAFASLATVGSDSTGRNLLSGNYIDALRDQVKTAAKQAAARAVHQLLTHERDLVTENGARWMVLPVPSPVAADKLRFTPQGRIFEPKAITKLPSDVSDLFTPNLMPLNEENRVSAREVQAFLSRRGEAITEAWQSATVPNIARVREWAKALRGDYVLMAHVTSLEMEESPLEEGGGKDREAQAETFGALVRVSDGKILWQDRASASLRVRPRVGQRKFETDAEIVGDAAMFALLELQRRFARYRAQFER